MERERAEAALLLPTKLLDMLESPLAARLDLSSFKACCVGGDECTHDLYDRFRERFGYNLAQLLGMTECEGYLANRPDGPNRVASVGKPAEGMDVRLVGSEGRDVPVGNAGQLVVRGPSVMVGYWHDEGATEGALVDGWLQTADVARRDADGFYYFVERLREIVIHDGSNIAPHEVEDAIDSHPAVEESCVVGVPDPHHGAVLKAYVELEPDARDAPDAEQMAAWLGERISAYKVPTLWAIMETLPRTATGKIDRRKLHRLAQEATQ
jgi:long-chain acyl-CoA synthetase